MRTSLRTLRAVARLAASILAGSLLTAEPARAGEWIFPEPSWKEADFQDRFMGRYGVNAYTEPQMDVENFNVYQGVLAQIENKQAAIAYLENGIRVLTEAGIDVSGALYFLLAGLTYESGRPHEAVEGYIAAVRAHPAFLRAYANLGFVLMEIGEADRALPVLLKAVELGANESQVHGLIGHIYAQKQLYGSGLIAFQWALVLNPHNNAWRLGALRCLIGLERYAEALGIAEEILAFDRRNADAWRNVANLHLQLDRDDEAIIHIQTSHALDGGRFRSHAQLGSLYYNKGMFEAASSTLVAAAHLAATPEDLNALLDPCLALSRWQHDTLADRLLSAIRLRAIEIAFEPDSAKVGLVRAAILTVRGDAHSAGEILEPLARQIPGNGDVQLALARAYAQSNRFVEAEARFEIARTFPDLAPIALYEQARIVLARGDVAGAVRLLRQAHGIQPDPGLAEHIRSLEEFAR